MTLAGTKPKPTNKSNPCPVCGDVKGKCRTLSDSLIVIVLCGNTDKGNEPSGWIYLKPAKNPLWNVFALDDGQSSSNNWQDRLEARNKRNAETERAKAKRLAALKPVDQRDQEYRAQPKTLSPKRFQSLIDRGLTSEEIQFAVEQHWIWDTSYGFAIAALSVGGKIQGCQIAKDDRKPKYIWDSINQSAHIPATGENPLFIWIHPKCDRTKPIRLVSSEGGGKSMYAALIHWRTGDYETVFVGAAGGIFGQKSLTALLTELKPTSVQYAPDAGWVDAKPNVIAGAQSFIKGCWKNDIKPTVLWWGQWTKPGKDIDELDGSEKIRLMSGKAFLDSKEWKLQQKFTPSIITFGEFAEFADAVQKGRSIFSAAGLGSGKTHEAIKALKRLNIGAIVITPSNKLGIDFVGRCERAGLKHVYHLRSEDDRRILADSSAVIVLCPDSLHLIQPQDFDGRVVVVDEAMGNWQAFLQRNTAIKRNRVEILERLEAGLERSFANILMDGNLNDNGASFYQSSKLDIKISHMPINPKRLKIGFLDTPSDQEILTRIDAAIAAKQKIVIVSDSLKDLKALRARYSDQVKTRLLCSESDGEEWQIEGLEDINRFISTDETELLLLSPSAGSGVDISLLNHFGHCFLLGRGVLLVNDLEQILARLRDATVPRTVWVPSQGLPSSTVALSLNLDEVKQGIEEYLLADLKITQDWMQFEEEPITSEQSKERLMAVIDRLKPQAPLIARDNAEREHLRSYFLEKLLDSGHEVSVIKQSDIESDQAVSKNQRAVKFKQRIEFAQAIHQEVSPTVKEYAKLKEKESLTATERAQIARFKLLNQLPGIENSHEWKDSSQTTSKDGEEQPPNNLLFIDRLLESNLINRAQAQILLNDDDAAAILNAQKWQRGLETGYIERIKSEHLYIQTLKECGLEAVLALPELTAKTKEVIEFLQNCRKAKNRKKLGKRLTKRDQVLKDLLEPIGFDQVLKSVSNGVRSYEIICQIPGSILDAVRHKIGLRLKEISSKTEQIEGGQKLRDKSLEPLQKESSVSAPPSCLSYIKEDGGALNNSPGCDPSSTPVAPLVSVTPPLLKSVSLPQVGGVVIHRGISYRIESVGTAIAHLKTESGLENWVEFAELELENDLTHSLSSPNQSSSVPTQTHSSTTILSSLQRSGKAQSLCQGWMHI